MIRGAIFDFDGTLLNSMWIWDEVGLRYLESVGVKAKPDLKEDLRVLSLVEAAEYMITEYKLDKTVEEVLAGFNVQVKESYEEYLQLKPGVMELLDRLNENRVKMIIASANDKNLIEAALRRLGVREYFYEILTCADVGVGKNDPEIYELALRHLGTSKKETYVFEDAFHAANTAKNAGFKVVGVYDASEPSAKELEAVADYYTSDFLNLEEMYV